MRWLIRSRRPIEVPTGALPPNKSAGLAGGTEFSGIVSMLFSGAGRQPISALPVLFLASKVWVTWL
jgi:hypothetical protein